MVGISFRKWLTQTAQPLDLIKGTTSAHCAPHANSSRPDQTFVSAKPGFVKVSVWLSPSGVSPPEGAFVTYGTPSTIITSKAVDAREFVQVRTERAMQQIHVATSIQQNPT